MCQQTCLTIDNGLTPSKNDCPYVTASSDDLGLDVDEMDKTFQVLHLNIQSFLKNNDKFKLLLEDLLENNVVFDIILMCESYLNDQKCPVS